MLIIKAGIDASGYRTAVRDYTEPTVVEELGANSYDADSATCVVLLDTAKGQLHVVDDGIGFSQEAIERIGILGAGSKTTIPYSKGKRHYLGSYGYGLKSSLNIAERVSIRSVSEDGEFAGVALWTSADSRPLYVHVLRYRTPFTTIASPADTTNVNAGDDLNK